MRPPTHLNNIVGLINSPLSPPWFCHRDSCTTRTHLYVPVLCMGNKKSVPAENPIQAAVDKASPVRLIRTDQLRRLNAEGVLLYELVPAAACVDFTVGDLDKYEHRMSIISWRWTFDKRECTFSDGKLESNPPVLDDGMIAQIEDAQMEYCWIDWACCPQFTGDTMKYIKTSPLLYERAARIVFYERSTCKYLSIGREYVRRAWTLSERMARNRNPKHQICVHHFLRPNVMLAILDGRAQHALASELLQTGLLALAFPRIRYDFAASTFDFIAWKAGVADKPAMIRSFRTRGDRIPGTSMVDSIDKLLWSKTVVGPVVFQELRRIKSTNSVSYHKHSSDDGIEQKAYANILTLAVEHALNAPMVEAFSMEWARTYVTKLAGRAYEATFPDDLHKMLAGNPNPNPNPP